LDLDKTFTDKASGKDAKRPQLEHLLSFVREGDTVFCHSMDRLARNLDDLRRIVLGLPVQLGGLFHRVRGRGYDYAVHQHKSFSSAFHGQRTLRCDTESAVSRLTPAKFDSGNFSDSRDTCSLHLVLYLFDILDD
jgi:hypothetical protein